MTKAQLLSLLGDSKDEDEIDDLIKPKEPPTIPPTEPPVVKDVKLPKDVKADTPITLTAAELMQLLKVDKQSPEKDNKEEKDDAEIFIY